MAKIKPPVTPGKKAKKKGGWKKKTAIGLGVVVLLITGMIFFPRYGTIKYGICKTFIELQDPYPSALQFVNANEDATSVFISYKRTDAFGVDAMNEMTCYFEETKDGKIQLDRVNLNGRRTYPLEDPEIARKFNLGISAIEKYPPSLIMPWAALDDIQSYR